VLFFCSHHWSAGSQLLRPWQAVQQGGLLHQSQSSRVDSGRLCVFPCSHRIAGVLPCSAVKFFRVAGISHKSHQIHQSEATSDSAPTEDPQQQPPTNPHHTLSLQVRGHISLLLILIGGKLFLHWYCWFYLNNLQYDQWMQTVMKNIFGLILRETYFFF
jgi:hypothetical protein